MLVFPVIKYGPPPTITPAPTESGIELTKYLWLVVPAFFFIVFIAGCALVGAWYFLRHRQGPNGK